MFCPRCRSEYVAGIAVCSDCGISLVENIPESAKAPLPEGFKFIEILETYNFSDIAMMKSLLEGNGIEYLLLGETFNQVRPFWEPVRLLIREDQSTTCERGCNEKDAN